MTSILSPSVRGALGAAAVFAAAAGAEGAGAGAAGFAAGGAAGFASAFAQRRIRLTTAFSKVKTFFEVLLSARIPLTTISEDHLV